MANIVVLDAGPWGMIAHPRPNPAMLSWLGTLLANGIKVIVPEIADFEVRRELLRARKTKSLKRLDQLKSSLSYVPITTDAMLVAAGLWALVRNKGMPTADNKSLDADVILAGQAKTLDIGEDDVVIATLNIGHLHRFAPAQLWEDIG